MNGPTQSEVEHCDWCEAVDVCYVDAIKWRWCHECYKKHEEWGRQIAEELDADE